MASRGRNRAAQIPSDHEGPVTSDPDGPGFYQTRGRGNKTGRVSPRQQMRGSARDQVYAKHGLIDQGVADPNQGQLFNADSVAGPRKSDAEIVKDRGVNIATSMTHQAPNGKEQSLQFGGARGYMPNLTTKQKVSALKSAQEARVESGTYRGGGATAEMMEDRTVARNNAGNQNWYGGVGADGTHDGSPGEAWQKISEAADRQQVSQGAMTRGVALTSPQSAWDMGTPGSPDHKFPNLSHAESVVGAADISRPYVDREEAEEIGSQVPTSDGGLGSMGAKAAGVHWDKGNDATDPTVIKSHHSQKAPNFRASLDLSHPEVSARRVAAESFTVDRHDARAAGIGGSKHLENRKGVYDVAAMTGTRTALKNGELPPNEQAREWVGQRGANQHENPHQGMLEPGTGKGGKIRTRNVYGNESTGSKRSATAERMGLEF